MQTNRVKFIKYKGRDIFYVDGKNASEEEALRIVEDAEVLRKKNLDKAPFYVMADFTDAKYNYGVVEKLKGNLTRSNNAIKKYAAVGVSGIIEVFASMIVKGLSYDVEFFDALEEAKEWLVKD